MRSGLLNISAIGFLGLAVAALLPAPAQAQDYLGGFLQAQQDANIREIQQSGNGKPQTHGRKSAPRQQMSAAARRAMAQRQAQLRPEYERRVRVHGKPAADAWLQREAQAAGRSEAQREKARHPR